MDMHQKKQLESDGNNITFIANYLLEAVGVMLFSVATRTERRTFLAIVQPSHRRVDYKPQPETNQCLD